MTRISKGLSIALMKPVIPYYIQDDTDPTDPTDPDIEMTLTLYSSEFNEDLTDFPLRVDMSDFTSDFWESHNGDADGLRAYDSSGNQLPIDVTYFNSDSMSGTVFIKTDISSSTDTVITLSYSTSLDKESDSGTYGQYAVWSDYEVSIQYPDTEDRTGKGYTADLDDLGRNEYIKESGNYISVSTGHLQGVTSDDTDYVFVTSTEAIYKYNIGDYSTKIVSNTNIIDDFQTLTGSDCDHVCDPCYYNGEIYVPINNYPALSPSQEYIVVIDPSDLSISRYYEISGLAGEQVSSLTYNPEDGYLWGCNYETGSQIHCFSLTGDYIESITLDITRDVSQSINYWNGFYYIATGNGDNNIYKYTLAGEYVSTFYEQYAAIDSRNEPQGEGIYISDSYFFTCTTENLFTVMSKDERYYSWSRLESEGINSVTSTTSNIFTASVSYKGTEEFQQSLLSFGEANLVIDDGDTIGVYDGDSGWMYPSSSDYSIFEEVRLGYYYNGESGRGLYVNGDLGVTESSTDNRDFSSYSKFYVGGQPANSNEDSSGYYQNAWLRFEIMSEEWMRVDSLNMSSDSGLYGIE